MNFPRRRSRHDSLPGPVATVRSQRDLAALLPRIRPGDLVVLDRLDLDAETARSLADRRPLAVLNATQFISGRFANLGPLVLVDAGVRLLQGRREQVLALRDGQQLRLHEGTLYDGAVVVLDVEELTGSEVTSRMEQASAGLRVQLASFAHAAGDLLQREEDLLLHGRGLPDLRTRLRDEVVVVVGPGATVRGLRRLRRFVRSSRAVVIGVDAGLDVLAARRLRAPIAVLSGAAPVAERTLRRSREVVLCDAGRSVRSQVEKLRLPFAEVSTTAAATDVGLLLARQAGARLVVPVGAPGSVEEFVDRGRRDQASNVLTRLRLGDLVVEAGAVPRVLSARPRPWRAAVVALVLALGIGVLALSPVGQRWRDDLGHRLPSGWGVSSGLSAEKAAVAARDRRIAALQDAADQRSRYIAGTAHAVVEASLAGRAVTLVGLPGADSGTVTALRTLLAAAGAQVTAQVTVLPAATSDAQGGLVDALTSQIASQNPDVRIPAGADGQQRLGALLARAAAVPAAARAARSPADPHAVAIASGLRAAGLVTSSIAARAALTLVVTGAHRPDDAALAALVAAYGAQVPTVVAGPADGPITQLRQPATSTLSTVDGSEDPTGRIAAVLALAARTRGTTGDWGALGHDGAVPPT